MISHRYTSGRARGFPGRVSRPYARAEGGAPAPRLARPARGTNLALCAGMKTDTLIHTILLADDVRLALEIEKTFFQRSGFRVLTATDGRSALEAAIATKPDLAVLDEVMPEMSGTEVCRLLKKRAETREVRVIITRSTDSAIVLEKCREVGADSFVPKTGGREALLTAAARLLHVPQ